MAYRRQWSGDVRQAFQTIRTSTEPTAKQRAIGRLGSCGIAPVRIREELGDLSDYGLAWDEEAQKVYVTAPQRTESKASKRLKLPEVAASLGPIVLASQVEAPRLHATNSPLVGLPDYKGSPLKTATVKARLTAMQSKAWPILDAADFFSRQPAIASMPLFTKKQSGAPHHVSAVKTLGTDKVKQIIDTIYQQPDNRQRGTLEWQSRELPEPQHTLAWFGVEYEGVLYHAVQSHHTIATGTASPVRLETPSSKQLAKRKIDVIGTAWHVLDLGMVELFEPTAPDLHSGVGAELDPVTAELVQEAIGTADSGLLPFVSTLKVTQSFVPVSA